jgi:hypothetical protein
MNKLKIFIWGINEDENKMIQMSQNLKKTADKYSVDYKLFGIGQKWPKKGNLTTQRIEIMKEYLENLTEDQLKSNILLFMDGGDTFFNDNLNIILDKFLKFNTRILFSAEKGYTYQYEHFKEKYDTNPSLYRYLNCGTFMGYTDSLLDMINKVISIKNEKKWYSEAIDQGLWGVWLYRHYDNKSYVQLDSNCEVFWVTTSDWKLIMDNNFSNNSVIINTNTNTRPGIIHYTGKGDNYLVRGYNKLYNLITQ